MHSICVDQFSVKEIQSQLELDPSLHMSIYAKGAMKDVLDSAQMIETIKERTPVGGLRFVQIHKAGANVLRIHLNKGEMNDRAAFISMDEYKRSFLRLSKNRQSNAFLLVTVCALLYAGYKIGKLHAKVKVMETEQKHIFKT